MSSYMPLCFPLFNWRSCCRSLWWKLITAAFVVIFIACLQTKLLLNLARVLRFFSSKLLACPFFIYNLKLLVGYYNEYIVFWWQLFSQLYFKYEWFNNLLVLWDQLIPILFNVISLISFILINFNHWSW